MTFSNYIPKNIKSVSLKLKVDGRSTEEFEAMIAAVSLEELIALKLELAARSCYGKLYGFPLLRSLPIITKDAIVKFVYSITKTPVEAAAILGITPSIFLTTLKSLKIKEYFELDTKESDANIKP